MNNKISNEMVYRLIWDRGLLPYSESKQYESDEVKTLLQMIDEKEKEVEKLYTILKKIVEPK